MNHKFILLLFLSLVLSGCGDDGMEKLQAEIARIKAQPRRDPDPIPDVVQTESFVYQEGRRKDPFELVGQAGSSVGQPSGNDSSAINAPAPRPKEYLERYSLDSLRMVGFIEEQDINWALVIDPNGMIHRVHAGNYVGKNYGQITRVTENRIELTEIIQDGAGSWQERQAAIALTTQDKPN
ncbi:hypothetical protein TI04_06340 [Achromatium sp. WMS2]|nr:hypothetical protein TI04_06340 [Achromatium sp. WMS2]